MFIKRLNKSFLGRIRYCINQEVNDNPEKKEIKINVKNICEDSLVQSSLNEILVDLPLLKRLVSICMKYKMITLLIIIFRMK